MRLVQFAVLVLVCSLAVRESLPLLVDQIETLACSSSHQDQLPGQDSDLPAPLEGNQVEGPISDYGDEIFSFLAAPAETAPFTRAVLRDGAHLRFSSSGDLLDTLQRLRI